MTNAARKSNKIWRAIDLINWGEQYFSDNKFDNPRREIEVLLQNILNCSRVDLYLRFEEPLSNNQLTKLRSWVRRRKGREPVQYITGKAGFYSLLLDVSPDVLIPRPESERIIDIALEHIEKQSIISVLDIGTGSGCLALAIAHELPNTKVIGIDNSSKAIEIAKANALTLQIENVQFIQSNFLKDNINGEYDIIISNPPYVPIKEMDMLMADVKDYEPHSALTDAKDGLTFYRKTAKIRQPLIKPDGWIILEVGIGKHPENAMQLFMNNNFKNVELIKDYNGDNRILKAQIA